MYLWETNRKSNEQTINRSNTTYGNSLLLQLQREEQKNGAHDICTAIDNSGRNK